MSKVRGQRISVASKQEVDKWIYGNLSKLDKSTKVKALMSDLFFESEIVMLERRVQIAKMLVDEAQYADIKKELGVGDSTIADVRKKLENGNGYLQRLFD